MFGNQYMKIGALGAGSDYSPFFQHLGIPSANIGYGGEGDGGEYHSIYDSYDHFTRFKDPGFQYGVALAQTAGRAMLRLANADVLPFDYSILSNTINEYLGELKGMLDQMRTDAELENKLIKARVFALAADPQKRLTLPKEQSPVPFMEFSQLDNALSAVRTSAASLKSAMQEASKLDASQLLKLNACLYQAEQKLLSEQGLPRRPWYRHQVYAPGFYTGYGVKTLPGVREGLEERNWSEAQERIVILTKVLGSFNTALQEAIGILK
jgi:N-acetylated-alpha-linked acidic dipeptidase